MRVVIIQRVLPHYRVPFFSVLSAKLAAKNIELLVLYGQEFPGQVPKTVEGNFPWAKLVRNHYFQLFGAELVWQPVFTDSRPSDLVIVEQANRLLVNYLLILGRAFRLFKVAFWGHGKNFQSTASHNIKETWKRFYSTNTDWWFCYTQKGADIIKSLDFNAKRITCVDNSIDVTALSSRLDQVNEQEKTATKNSVGFSSDNIGIYCGGMYPDKKIPFLLEACSNIKKLCPDFEMIFIGDGPESNLIEEFADRHQWATYLGKITGTDRVPYFSIAKIFLMPGLVGLSVLDSFAMKVPMITTDIPIHSPEYDYLIHGVNGCVTVHEVSEYAKVAADLLIDEPSLSDLKKGCNRSLDRYSIENMADNFATGIVSCLGLPD